ncbi:MAG: hypothetical protein ACR2GK_09650 [Gemmatimonadaceae bacterium]
MISEFYSLRRTAIKDIAAYLGFLVGFIGSAPFAWGLLAAQLDAGRFARALWYFFGIVTTAGIFAGIAGLGVGIAAGLLWEQFHRHRRAARAARTGALHAQAQGAPPATRESDGGAHGAPKLQLVTFVPPAMPDISGRRVASVLFSASGAEIDFGGVNVPVGEGVRITGPAGSFTYPEPGAREALCGAIGARVERVSQQAGGTIEVRLDGSWSLILPRATDASGDRLPRRASESPA